MDILLAPLHYEFFRTGLIAAPIIGALCGMLGVYIVLRGMSYIGHGLSHAAFGGAVIGYVLNLNFYIGAGLWGFLAAILINQVVRKNKIGADAAIGVITTASFAIGVALISRVRHFTKNFEAALFGNILGVTWNDVMIILAVFFLTLIVIFVLYKQLLFTTFDEETARVYGVSTAWVDTFFSLILAAAIIASMQILGVTLIAAAIVIPAITARQLTDSFNKMLFYSVGMGALTSVLGMYASFYLDIASGASIVLFAAALFSGVLLFKSIKRAGESFQSTSPEPLLDEVPHEHPHRHQGVLHLHEHKGLADQNHDHHQVEHGDEKGEEHPHPHPHSHGKGDHQHDHGHPHQDDHK
ncbi:MAG: metal ABC transporter permease [Nitrospirae bacterium]|nr:metal ABC transporter permease [Nitrospirota bacterium]MBI3594657.1 metal ABC transporter permease [Nitrospirota bacterium]